MFFLPSSSTASSCHRVKNFCFGLLLSHLKDISTTSPAHFNKVYAVTKTNYDYNSSTGECSSPSPVEPLGIVALKFELTAFTVANGQPVPPQDLRVTFIAKGLLDPQSSNKFFKNPSTTTLEAVRLKGRQGSSSTTSRVVSTRLNVELFCFSDKEYFSKMLTFLAFPDLQVTQGAEVFAPQVLLMISGKTRDDGAYEYSVDVFGNCQYIYYILFKKDGLVVSAAEQKFPNNPSLSGVNRVHNYEDSITVITGSGQKAEYHVITEVLSTKKQKSALTDDEFRKGIDNIADFTQTRPMTGEPWYRVPWKLGLFTGVLVAGVVVLLSAIFLLLRKKTTNK